LIEVQKALEAAGIEFIGTPEDGPGIRLRRAAGVKAPARDHSSQRSQKPDEAEDAWNNPRTRASEWTHVA
jgi:hypothetical protein